MRQLKAIVGIMLIMLSAFAFCGSATIMLTSFPDMSVADGKSTATISAELRDQGGNLVPDGTRVVFSSDIGSFREALTETQHGIARAVFVAGSVPGVAKITVSAISYQATGTLDYELVSDRALLSSAKEYAEITGPNDLQYSVDYKTVGASGPGQTAVLIYKDIEIRADDLQMYVPNYEVRAKKAHLKIGSYKGDFPELYIRLNRRTGYGLATYRYKPLALKPMDGAFAFEEQPEQEAYGIAEIDAAGVKKPSDYVQRAIFDFTDLSTSASYVTAKKAYAYPRKSIQFQKADVFVGGARIMRMPFYEVSILGQPKVITDNYVNFNDNQIALNYPYYLSLKPGMTSLLRLQTGTSGGRETTVNRGTFLNYELNWDHGDDMQGGFQFQGIGRKDWGLAFNQYLRFKDGSDFNGQIQFPAHSAIWGNVSYDKQFKGYSFDLTASDTHTVDGPASSSQDFVASIQSNPIKVDSHFKATVSVQASKSMSSALDTFSESQSAFGPKLQITSSPYYIDRDTTFTPTLSFSKLFGQNVLSGLTTAASLSLNRNIKYGGVTFTYDYLNDGFNSNFIGKHQLSSRLLYNPGRFTFQAFAAKALDIDRVNYQLDTGWVLGRDWRLAYSYTFERYLGESFLDYNFVLGYTIGYREFGLTWSLRTKRFGIQVLGTTIR